jgi:hypothetical protein
MEGVISSELLGLFFLFLRACTHMWALKGPETRLVEQAGTVPRNIHEWNGSDEENANCTLLENADSPISAWRVPIVR